MNSKDLYDAKEYWNDIKIWIIPRIRKENHYERIEYLIEQIEVSLETNDTSMFDFDVENELWQVAKKYKTFALPYMIIIYDMINFMIGITNYSKNIKYTKEDYKIILKLTLQLFCKD